MIDGAHRTAGLPDLAFIEPLPRQMRMELNSHQKD